MPIRFFVNLDTGLAHIYDHNVDEQEVVEVLRRPLEEFSGKRGSVIAHG